MVRGAVLGVKENVYFQAAQAIGSSRRRSLLRHVLPNIAAPIIIIFSINVGSVSVKDLFYVRSVDASRRALGQVGDVEGDPRVDRRRLREAGMHTLSM